MCRAVQRFAHLSAIVCAGLALAGAAAASDPFAGDARIAAKRSLRFQNAVVRDLLADLHEQTGISFFADSSVADDRVTVLTHDRSLSETLRAIAGFHQWEWQRDGTRPYSSYTLKAGSLDSNPASYIESRRKLLADLLYDEIRIYQELSGLPQKQREDIEGELPTLLAQAKDPAAGRRMRIQSFVLQDLRMGRQWKQPIYRFLATVPREAISALVHADTTYYCWPRLPGVPELPETTAGSLRAIVGREYAVGQRFDVAALRLRITPVLAAREPVLRLSLLVHQRNSYGSNQFGLPGVLPASYSLLADKGESRQPIEPANWQSDANLAGTINLHVASPAHASRAGSDAAPTPSPSGYWMSDALAKIATDRPIDFIADSLWSTRIATTDIDSVPAGEALTRLCRATDHRWWQQDGFVMIRSAHYDSERWAEPPALAVQRWREDADQGLFGLDDYAEMAALPDAQGFTLQSMSSAGLFPTMFSPLSNARSQLLLWNALTPAQRRQAYGDGLKYALLSTAEQRLYLLAVTDPFVSPVSPLVLDADILSHSNVKVRFQDSLRWGVRRPGYPSTLHIPRGSDADMNGLTREDALHAFQRGDSSVRLPDIQPMVLTIVTFRYDSDRDGIAQIYVQLPPRWEKQ